MPGKINPCVSFTTNEKHNHISCFGFELKNIKKTDQANLEILQANCLNWHKRFFNAMSNSDIDFFVKYIISNEGKTNAIHGQPLHIRLLFFIKSNTLSELKKETESLINVLMMLFEPEKSFANDPYTFSAITDSDCLMQKNEKNVDVNCYEFKRKPVFMQPSIGELGYNKKQEVAEDKLEFIPQFFLPDFLSLTNIIQYIFESSHFVELSLILAPFRFSDKEQKHYKQRLKKWKFFDDTFTKSELEAYQRHLELIFDNNTSLFFLQVKLKTSVNQLFGQSFQNIIADTFFGNIHNVDVDISANDNEDGFIKEADKDLLLPYVYPQELAIMTFRLPVPTADENLYFSNQTNIFGYIPFDLPREGVKMGVKKNLKHKKEIFISKHDLARHTYILGQTGVGKTTLLKTMVLDQIRNGEGVCVVDPHGDLVNEIQKKIPENRKQDLIYFDPTTTKDIRINIIEVNPDFPEQRTFIFNELMKFFSEIYNMSMVAGPAFEQYFKNALFLIIEKKGTLADMYRFYLDKEYRETTLAESEQQYPVDFFRNAVKISGEWSFEAFASYIVSKINRFVQDDFIGPIINSPTSTINFRELIDKKKILLVRLPKGRLGSDGVSFIGSIIFNRIIMAAYTRENIDVELRTPYNLYVDEFQNFTSEDVVTALSESRKYGLRLILANQTLRQIKDKIVDIILGNIGSQIIFRPGIMDIEKLNAYYSHYISPQELLNLPNFYAVARLLNNDAPLKPFIFETVVE
ncbi:MAG: type IV secretion system DNA-binding domain-containing protein [Paludibacteraceae bacterium]|nr:type IV secretion system DNA-binding domain-containing protein [Paludibacteraceae bacterium]